MRLTADLIRGAPAYINPLKERELSLRGYKISKIENLGVTEDQYDVLDLSDNEILKLENFPLLQRLHAILLNNNRLCRISKGLGEFLPRLITLILTGNKITNLEDIDNLAELPRLTHLSLLNNPISKQDHYRLYVIHKLPKLKVLDFRKVKPSERKEAEKKFGPSTVSKPKENKMKSQAKTFVVGDGIPQPKKKGLIPEQRRKIMEAIKKATSLGEIERLEKILSSGKIPSDFELDPSLKESSQNGEKKEGESEKDSKDTKSTEKVDTESENKEKSTKNKDDAEDDALADQEGDDEEDASRREIADAQVDIEMTE